MWYFTLFGCLCCCLMIPAIVHANWKECEDKRSKPALLMFLLQTFAECFVLLDFFKVTVCE